MGTIDELNKAIDIIERDFDILATSNPYQNRNSDSLYRVYIEFGLKRGEGECMQTTKEKLQRY